MTNSNHHIQQDTQQANQQPKEQCQVSHRPAVVHPNFDPNQTPLDPERPLTDIPEPARRRIVGLENLYDQWSDSKENYALQSMVDESQSPCMDRLTQLEQANEQTTLSTQWQQEQRSPNHHRQAHRQAQRGQKGQTHIPFVMRLTHDNLSQYNSYDEDESEPLSKWDLIRSPVLASHLELLQAAHLIELPTDFFQPPTPANNQPLIQPITTETLTLLDMSDIYQVIQDYPTLTRYGLAEQLAKIDNQPKCHDSSKLAIKLPEMLNDIYAPDWEVILYPERFDNGIDSLLTDVLPCSVALYILRQCQTRKTINRRLYANQICHYLRSYVLSQCRLYPLRKQFLRQMRLFVGHVIVAAVHLGWQVMIDNEGRVHFNVSSRSALFTRYPNLTEYYVNGWS